MYCNQETQVWCQLNKKCLDKTKHPPDCPAGGIIFHPKNMGSVPDNPKKIQKPTVGSSEFKNICPEILKDIDRVEQKYGISSQTPQAILYHGIDLVYYLVNRLFAIMSSQNDNENNRQIARIFNLDNSFPDPMYFPVTEINNQWNRDIYSKVVEKPISNYRQFWQIIYQDPTFYQKLVQMPFVDNRPYFKSFLMSYSTNPLTTTAGESAMGYLLEAVMTPQKLAKLDERLNKPKSVNITTRQITKSFIHNFDLHPEQEQQFQTYLFALRDLLTLRSLDSRELNKIEEIESLVKREWGISDIYLEEKPKCVQNLSYDWAIYQVVVPDDVVRDWVYISYPGGYPMMIVDPDFDLVKYLQQFRFSLDQVRLLPGPSFNQGAMTGRVKVIPLSNLNYDTTFNTLIETLLQITCEDLMATKFELDKKTTATQTK